MSKGPALADAYLPVSLIEPERPLSGNSELSRLMREFDWPTTALGHQSMAAEPEDRGQNHADLAPADLDRLGQELIILQRSLQVDHWRQASLGLGKAASEVWREIWHDIGPMLRRWAATGTYVEAQLLIMERNGYPEETYYTFSYSPIPADDGTVGGIFCANTDDTQRVIGERQLALLRELAATHGRGAYLGAGLRAQCARALHRSRDLPFAMIYCSNRTAHGDARRTSGINPTIRPSSPH